MKRFWIVLMLALPLAGSSAALACRHGKGGKEGQKQGRHHGHKQKLKKLLKTFEKVGVKQESMNKIKAHLEKKRPEMKALHEKMMDAKKTADPLVIQEARLKMMEKKLEVTSDIRAFVTDAEWTAAVAKLKEKRAKHKEKRRARMQKKLDHMSK
ncbi:MAG: hypothetical protein GY822_29110 [Deltaproteobacteria bacterium]|nr:hypothetical protein [Deltaproteobacteria bacterium]